MTLKARRLSHVVGIGLECQTPQSNRTACKFIIKEATNFRRQDVVLSLIDLPSLPSICPPARRVPPPYVRARASPLKARPAKAGARVEEVRADTRIRADAVSYMLDVHTEPISQICHLVHEGNAHCEHAVGGVLGEFRRADIHHDQAIAVSVERRI